MCCLFSVLLDTSDEKSTCREAGTSPPSDKTILSLEPSPTKTGVPSLGPEEQWLNGEVRERGPSGSSERNSCSCFVLTDTALDFLFGVIHVLISVYLLD